jgi:uncharacterized delta-60 repeat protein
MTRQTATITPRPRRGLRCPGQLALLALLLQLALATLAIAAGGDIVAPFPQVDSQPGKQEATAMAVDGAGNCIVVGATTIGGTNNDYRVAKFKADGSGLAWTPVTFDRSGGDDTATAVAVDGNGDIIVTGYSWNGANFDIQTIKYAGSTGTLLWQHTFAGAANGNDFASAIAVDGTNDIYVAGYTANAAGNDDLLIIKYPAAGATPTWTEIHDDATYHGNDRITAIAAGTDGIAVTGYSAKSGADFDIITRKYGFDQSFIREWRRSTTGSTDDRGIAVKLDSLGNVIVTGYLTVGTTTDLFTAKYAPASATPLWEQIYDGGYDDRPRALWVDAGDAVYVTGDTFTLNGHEDIYTVRYRADGTKAWDALYHSGNENDDIPLGIVVSDRAEGGVFVTGYTTTAINDNITILKYLKDPPTTTGRLLWQNTHNGTANKNDRPVGIGLASLTAASDVLIGGWSEGSTTSHDFLALRYDPGPLNAPTWLTASAVSNTAITLAWTDNAANEETFVIQRKLGESGTFADLVTVPATLPANTVTYTDTGLTPNSYYYYRVRARNAANGDSAQSNEAHALTKVVSYHDPTWSYLHNGADNREDRATGLCIGTDDNPVVTGTSDLAEEGVTGTYSFDYVTIKLDRGDTTLKWLARYDSGDGGTDMAAGVALDSSGNAIVTGTSYRMGGSDKSDDLYTIKYQTAGYADSATNPPLSWDHQYGTQSGIDLATAVKVARNGSDQSVVIGHGMNAANNYDMFLIKYNADGTRPWPPVVFDSGRDDLPTDVAFDSTGNLLLTGYSRNAAGNDDWFTAKYDGATGALIWSATYAGAGGGDDQPLSLAVDTLGNAVVTGFGVNAAGNEEMVTIKYDGAQTPTGTREIWRKIHNGPAAPVNGDDRGIAVALDPIDGAVIVAGTSYASTTDSDFHLIRYNPADGAILWERNFDKPDSYDYVSAMAVDSSGYLYVTGTTRGGPDTDSAFDGTADIVSLIYDFEGTFLDALRYTGGGRQDEAAAIAVNYRGEAFIAGTTRNAGTPDYLLLKQTNEYILVPAPLTLVPQADAGTMRLTWRENTAGTSFRIERTLGPVLPTSNWSVVTTAGSGTTSHTDSGLTPGTNYCYRIYAFSGSLNSRTIESCGTTTLAAPTLAVPTVDSTTHISLAWNQVSGNTGYKIERKIGAGSWSDLTTTAADVTSHSDTGLTPGTTYAYRVSSNSAAGYSLPSNERSTSTRPVAPTLNAPTGITNTQMSLAWNAVTGATSYTLQLKDTENPFANYGSCTAIAGTSCTVTGLTPTTTYTFRVLASNSGGDSAWSSEQSGTAVLGVPTLNAPASVTKNSMNLSWATVSGATTYTLEYKLGTGGTYGPSGCIAIAGTSCSVTGLTENQTYYFRVKAGNGAGDSTWSSEQNAKTLLAEPTLSAVTALGTSSIRIDWTDTASETGYQIERTTCSDSNTNAAGCATGTGYATSWTTIGGTRPANEITYTDSSVVAGTQYKYRVKATVSGNSSITSAELYTATFLAQPAMSAVSPVNTTTFTVTWTDVTGETSYTLERKQGVAGTYAEVAGATSLAKNVLTYTDSGLATETEYCYRVKAATSYGVASVYSSNELCKTTPLAAPTLTLQPVASSTQIDLTWTAVTGATGYEIERCTTSDNQQPITHPLGTCATFASPGAGETSYSNTGLTAGYTYSYKVRAKYNAADVTGPSNEIWVTTTPATPTMTAPAAATATTTQLIPSWNNVAGDNGYKLSWKVRSGADCTAGSWSGPIALGMNVTSYTHTGLTAGTYYCYPIIPNGPPGTPDSGTSSSVAQTTRPVAPVLNSLGGITTARIDLSWSNVSGNTGYQIDRSPDNVTWSNGIGSVGQDVTTFASTGLTPGTRYYYRVSASSGSGYSAVSNVLSATTTPAATTVTTTVIAADRIDLAWPVVYGATHYKVEQKEGAGSYQEIANLPVTYGQKYCDQDYPTTACPALSPLTTGYAASGLKENTSYCYQVKPWNSTGGDGAASAERCATTSAMPTQNLTATALDSFRVRLDWSPIACTPNPCDTPGSFAIEKQVREGIWVPLATVTGSTFTYTDRLALEPGHRYRYRVRSVSGADVSPYSEATTVTPSYTAGATTCP